MPSEGCFGSRVILKTSYVEKTYSGVVQANKNKFGNTANPAIVETSSRGLVALTLLSALTASTSRRKGISEHTEGQKYQTPVIHRGWSSVSISLEDSDCR